MRVISFVTIFSLTSLAAGQTDKWTLTLKKEDEGKLPKNWTAALTGKGEAPTWKVVADKTAPSKSGLVLAQTSVSADAAFNLCVHKEFQAKGVELTVSFKAEKGTADQGGGLLWRYRDENNYYVARYNPLESNFRVYKVIDGKRTQLASKEDLKAKAGEWHTLAITNVGNRIICKLDGAKYLEVTDDALPLTGKIGLWTKADAQTSFDGLIAVDRGNGKD